MTAWGEAALLIELLDRQFAYLGQLHGTARIQRLPRLLSFLAGEPRLAGVIADARVEAAGAVRTYESADSAVRRELGSVWAANRDEVRAWLAGDPDGALSAYGDLPGYDERLLSGPVIEMSRFGEPTERERHTERLLLALKHWSKCVTDLAGDGDAPVSDRIRGVAGRTSRLVRVHKHAAQRLREASVSLPGPAFDRLVHHARLTNPEPPNSDDATEWMLFEQACEFATTLRRYDETGLDDVEKLEADEVYNTVERDARLLHEELRFRVGIGRTRLATMLRFAARCEAFDAHELRARCDADPANAERILTLELARFVFDQGLVPLLDPTVGGLRPDVLHVAPGDALYVEAKQYKDASPKTSLIRAYAQVWGTLMRLRKVHALSEAYLVVFRRSGPLVELPPVVRFQGLALHSVLVDISATGGSREKEKVVHIDEADLLPAPEVEA